MTWVRLDDGFADHPKLEQVGPLAGWLFVCGLCYCARHSTDGLIPKVKAHRLTELPKAPTVAGRLVEVGLWDDEGDNYRVHDYLDYQPSRAKVLADREADAERKRKGRTSGKRPAGIRQDLQTDSDGTSARNPAVPSRPVPVEDSSSNSSPTPVDNILEAIVELRRHPDIKNRSAWRATVLDDLHADGTAAKAADLLTRFDATPQQFAAYLEGEKSALTYATRKEAS